MLYRHLKSNRKYIRIAKVVNGTNAQDGQVMILYFGKYKDKIRFGFFVREVDEFNEKFKKIKLCLFSKPLQKKISEQNL